MSEFTPRRLREISGRAGGVTANTARTPAPGPFGSYVSEGEGDSGKSAALETPAGLAAVPRLPGPLERLVRAAAAADGAWGPAAFETGLVLDLRAHVLAWACAHLLGDCEAVARLWAALAARERKVRA